MSIWVDAPVDKPEQFIPDIQFDIVVRFKTPAFVTWYEIKYRTTKKDWLTGRPVWTGWSYLMEPGGMMRFDTRKDAEAHIEHIKHKRRMVIEELGG